MDAEDKYRDSIMEAIGTARDNGVSYDTIIAELEMAAMTVREEADNAGDE